MLLTSLILGNDQASLAIAAMPLVIGPFTEFVFEILSRNYTVYNVWNQGLYAEGV